MLILYYVWEINILLKTSCIESENNLDCMRTLELRLLCSTECSVSSTHRLATLCEISFFPIPNQTFSLFPVHFSLSFAAHPQKEPDIIFVIFCHQILENRHQVPYLALFFRLTCVADLLCTYIHMYTQITYICIHKLVKW